MRIRHVRHASRYPERDAITRLKFLREKLELSQEGMAHLLGVSVRTISRWETSHTAPRYEILKRLTILEGVSRYVGSSLPASKLVQWLTTAQVELNYCTPIVLLESDFGRGKFRELMKTTNFREALSRS
jgi:transcriptional regulator with XRE-family HTH domain